MASVHGPLMSLDAAGTVGDLLQWQGGRRRPIVRIKKNPRRPSSTERFITELGFSFAARAWASSLPIDRSAWDLFAAKSNSLGRNAFTTEVIKRFQNNLGPRSTPPPTPSDPLADSLFTSVTSSSNSISVTWIQAGAGTPLLQILLLRTGHAFTIRSHAKLFLIPSGLTSHTFDNLTSGPYTVAIWTSNLAGTILGRFSGGAAFPLATNNCFVTIP